MGEGGSSAAAAAGSSDLYADQGHVGGESARIRNRVAELDRAGGSVDVGAVGRFTSRVQRDAAAGRGRYDGHRQGVESRAAEGQVVVQDSDGYCLTSIHCAVVGVGHGGSSAAAAAAASGLAEVNNGHASFVRAVPDQVFDFCKIEGAPVVADGGDRIKADGPEKATSG